MTTDVVTRQAVLLNADPDAAEIGNLYRLARGSMVEAVRYPPRVKAKRTCCLSGDGLLIGPGSPQA
jgi:hypothetical protein